MEDTTRDDICYSSVSNGTYIAAICPVSCGVCPLCTAAPTDGPTVIITNQPTEDPTVVSTDQPSEAPTVITTDTPSLLPSEVPTTLPTDPPSRAPTYAPTHYVIDAECCFDQCFFIISPNR